MKILPERTSYSILLVLVLAAILVALAVLQYRWSSQISETENEHMRSSLRTSMDQFRRQFHNDLQELGFLARPNDSVLVRRDWKSYAESCSVIFRNSGSHLVSNIYLWVPADSGNGQLLKLNQEALSFEEIPWPSNLDSIRRQYSQFFSKSFRPMPLFRPFAWTMFFRIPLMIQPLIPAPSPSDTPVPGVRFFGFVMLELNAQAIYKGIFPELAQRIFKSSGGYLYHVAVVSGEKPGNLLFQSDPNLTMGSFDKVDAAIPLLERRSERFDPMMPRLEPEFRRSGNRMQPPPPNDGLQQRGPDRPQVFGSSDAMSMGPMRPGPDFPGSPRFASPIQFEGDGAGWELIAKHREGSLEAAVARSWRRNLAISFGSLLILTVSMALIVVAARRAQRLARLQLDFVAGISHELRTPLAVICAAGDNLAEGVLESSHRSVKEYGSLILNEGRKLAVMVEQILQYAAAQRRTRPINLRIENLNEIANSALQQMNAAIMSDGFAVEKALASELPPVLVDAAAVTSCLNNLIQNALKYSGESRWIGVRTMTVPGKHNDEVQLIVEDRGMGIASEDLLHIFEPFYRGSVAIAAQIHGTGLGLFLAQQTIMSMQGGISVKSVPGKGSTFTIHLPVPPGTHENSYTTAGKG
jgi:signal transduction histidine kinase